MTTVIRARCGQCGYSAAYTGRTLDEVRRMLCPACATQGKQSRLTVYGAEPETIPAARMSPPADERVAMSTEYREIVNEKARRLVLSALDEEDAG